MESAIKKIIADVHERVRIDTYLSQACPAYSRSYFKRLIRQKMVYINGAPCLSSHKVKHGEEIHVTFADDESRLIPENTPLDILHEDGDILVLNKPPGMVVHPAAEHRTGTLAHAIAGYIGSHVVRALQRAGRAVVVFDSFEKGHLEAVRGIPFFKGDLRRPDDIRAVFKQHAIDAVMHFAAYIEVG